MNGQIIDDILSQAKVNKNGVIINKNRLNDMIHAAHLTAVTSEYISDVMPSLHTLNFRELRKAKGLTLRKVEEITGISNAYLSQIENGLVESPGYVKVKILYNLYCNEA